MVGLISFNWNLCIICFLIFSKNQEYWIQYKVIEWGNIACVLSHLVTYYYYCYLITGNKAFSTWKWRSLIQWQKNKDFSHYIRCPELSNIGVTVDQSSLRNLRNVVTSSSYLESMHTPSQDCYFLIIKQYFGLGSR